MKEIPQEEFTYKEWDQFLKLRIRHADRKNQLTSYQKKLRRGKTPTLGIFTHTFLGFTGDLDDEEEERQLYTGKKFVKDPSIK